MISKFRSERMGHLEIAVKSITRLDCGGGTHLKGWYGYVQRSRPLFHASPGTVQIFSCFTFQFFRPPLWAKWSILTPAREICPKILRIFSSVAKKFASINIKAPKMLKFQFVDLAKKIRISDFRPPFRRLAQDIPTQAKVECPLPLWLDLDVYTENTLRNVWI